MSWHFSNRTSEELPRERAGCPDQEGLGECSYLFMCLHADLISSWFSGLPQAAKRKRKVAILFEAKGILWFKNKSKLDSDFLLPSYSSISTWQSITVDANPVTGSISFPLPPLTCFFRDESQVRHKEECLLKRATFTHQILGGIALIPLEIS